MSTEVAAPPQNKNQLVLDTKVRNWMTVESVRKDLESALAGFISADTFIAQIVIACSKPEIKKCVPDTIFSAIHTCAALTLLPTLQEVALIPREIKAKDQSGRWYKTGTYEVTVMPQWQGLKNLMLRNQLIEDIHPVLVHKSDKHDFDPMANKITRHEYDCFDPERTFKSLDDIKGGYAVITYRDGRIKHHVCDKQVFIDAYEARTTKGDYEKNDAPWIKYPREQMLKTILRNMWNRRTIQFDLTLGQKLQAVEDNENAIDAEYQIIPEPVANLTAPQTAEPQPAKTRSQQTAEKARKSASKPATTQPEPTTKPAVQQEQPRQQTKPAPVEAELVTDPVDDDSPRTVSAEEMAQREADAEAYLAEILPDQETVAEEEPASQGPNWYHRLANVETKAELSALYKEFQENNADPDERKKFTSAVSARNKEL